MPLLKDGSKRSFKKNIATLVAEKKPIKQAEAIAYREGGETNRRLAAAIRKGRR